MYPRRVGPSLLFHPLASRAACLVAVALMLFFSAAVGAAAPEAAGVTGTITTGSAGSAPGFYYGDVFGYLPPGTTGGITCGGVYGCPFYAPPFGYGTTYVRGNLYCGLYTCGIVQTIQR
ncbi:MAG: hypothetical protein ACR2M3_07375 [Thermomicrobiales bacterium]